MIANKDLFRKLINLRSQPVMPFKKISLVLTPIYPGEDYVIADSGRAETSTQKSRVTVLSGDTKIAKLSCKYEINCKSDYSWRMAMQHFKNTAKSRA